jgi:hypothetical protein
MLDMNGPWWQRPVAHPQSYAGEKGAHDGICARIACDNAHAFWFNATNGKYYCGTCAKKFNEVSRQNGEHPLCELRL